MSKQPLEYWVGYRLTEAGHMAERKGRVSKYGLTLQEYENMLWSQNYVCAICGNEETRKGIKYLSIDHDHKCCPTSKASCGKCVRGLLCFSCNRRLGILENTDWVDKAQYYLESRSRNA